MGNSTTSLQDVIDGVAARGNVNPQANPAGYNLTTCLSIANDVMNDLIAKRFNWKWNSALIAPFLTNQNQQDYPQIGISNVGWLEGGWAVDINSSTRPQPFKPLTVDRDLDPVSSRPFSGRPEAVCWMYNRQLQTGVWPGMNQVYGPLLGAAVPPSNGPMAIRDSNGNILVLTQFGVTGAVVPTLPAASPEGTTFPDGTCVWTVASPDNMGFRLDSMPPNNGPIWQINLKYQQTAVKFTTLEQLINPVPDDQVQSYRRGYNATAHDYSSDPKAQAAFPALRQAWIESMLEEMGEGNREADSYMLIPATQVVLPAYGYARDPRNPGTPY